MTIEQLREQNPRLTIYEVTDAAFAEYGIVLSDFDITAITASGMAIPMPEEGSVYHASEEAFEALPLAAEIQERIFGTLPAQLGFCYGYSHTLNAAEWHASSELNIALTPLVLILGKRSDIRDGVLNSADMKAFFVPAGTVIEVYATTLHFCPCQTQDGGFRCVVGLPVGTNVPLDAPTADPLLFRKNKWIIAHRENKALLERGVVGGIVGENYTIRY